MHVGTWWAWWKTCNSFLFTCKFKEWWQSKDVQDLLKMYTLEDSRLAKTRTSIATKIDQDKACKKVKVTSFIGAVSSLLYLTANWPDSMFSIFLSARFQVDPRESYHIANKWFFFIFRDHQILVFGTIKILVLTWLAI